MQCRNLAAELGLSSVEAYKMDATAAVQSSGQARSAASELGEMPSVHPVMFGFQLHASSIVITPEGYNCVCLVWYV